MRRARRAAIVIILAAFAAAVLGAVPAGAGEEGLSAFVIRKVVSGPATEGSSIAITCKKQSDGTSETTVTLSFDATGAPTTAAPSPLGFAIVDGAWVLDTTVPTSEYGRGVCTATETVTGGAASTAWTCAFVFTAGTEPTGLGCSTASGTGVGPATAVFGSAVDEIQEQTWTVVFTNTYEAPPVVEVAPTFTG